MKQLSFEDRLKIHAALTHSTRSRLLRTIARDRSASFTKLKDKFKLNPNTLNYHLKVLERGGLICSSYKKRVHEREYSMYALTPLGREILSVDDYKKWL